MTEAREALVKAAKSLRELPSFIGGIGQDGQLLRIEISTNTPPFNIRHLLNQWLFCSVIVPAMNAGSLNEVPLFRGISREAFGRALTNGIDVVPSDHHWYGSTLEKALEYGGNFPTILILDRERTQRTFLELEIDAPPEDHALAREFARSEPITSKDGRTAVYSRIPETDNRRGSPYEFAHAYFIPGDASSALLGYLIGQSTDIRTA